MRTLTPGQGNNTSVGGVEAIDQLRLQLGSLLQTTLELDQLVSNFAQHMQTLFEISGVCFVAKDPEVRTQCGETVIHHCCYQLRTDSADIGEISLYSRKRMSETNLMLIEIATSTLVYPLRNALLYREALVTAHRDPLTTLGNRLAMNAALKREVSRAVRHETPLSVLMIDIDHFKSINDQYGHATGDEVLAEVAKVLRSAAREADNAFRYGGEEFLLLLDGTDAAGAQVAAERLRQQVAKQQPDIGSLLHTITVSVGCASLEPGDTPNRLITRADSALYQAKNGGRNCVRAA